MVKKISAIVLALVLCLSVAILPANAAAGFDGSYVFAAGKTSAFRLELDQATYNPGETVTVSVYFRFADDVAEIKSSYLTFGVNSALFDKTNSANATITGATACPVWKTYWKDPTSSQWGWCNDTIAGRINKANSETEKSKYDTYLRVSLAQDTDRVTDTTHGVVASELNASQPLLTFKLKLRDDIAPGTAINIGMPSGAVTCAPAQTTVTVFTDPGNATTGKPQANTTYDVSEAVASASIASAGPVVAKSKAQIRMTKTGENEVAPEFSYRVISKITKADWDKYFSGTLDSDTELGGTYAIQKVGFVVAETANFVLDDAKAAAKKYAESATPDTEDLGVYKVATTNFIQKVDDNSDAFFACRMDTSVSTKSDRKYIAFVQYKDGEGNLVYAFYDQAEEILLDSKYDDYKQAWLGQN